MLVTVVLLSSAGVHCTHGFNRTGFLMCAYLVEKMDWRSENTHDHTEHMHSNSWGWAVWSFTTLWVILYYSHGIYHDIDILGDMTKQHFASSFCVTMWEASYYYLFALSLVELALKNLLQKVNKRERNPLLLEEIFKDELMAKTFFSFHEYRALFSFINVACAQTRL